MTTSELLVALRNVRVSPDGTQAWVAGTEVEAPSTRTLAGRLGLRLYQRLHAGNESDGDRERDSSLEESLAEATPHRTTPTVVRPAPEGAAADVVIIDGLRVRLPADLGVATVRDLPAGRPALSPGHYLVDSPGGRLQGSPVLRVYLHLLGPADGVARWHDVLTALNDAGTRYRAKIVSTPGGYPRRDAMVVYLGPGHWDAAALIRDTVAGRPGIGPETSLFADALTPGVAIAWDPVDRRPGYRELSFGEHRARVTAEALLPGPDRAAALAEAFAAASIDETHPARNLNSPSLVELGARQGRLSPTTPS